MQNNPENSLLGEIVRGIKVAAQLSILLVMAGCQGQPHESEQSIFEMFARMHPLQQAKQLIGR
ncbi:MAG: hypothetical protein RL173_257 [Fibrobacterota bacterium]|jgi:hypothetical protein